MSRARLPILEPLPSGDRMRSDYVYLYPLRDGSGLHAFTEAGTGTGHIELFSKRKAAPAGWHLIRGAYRYEYVTSQGVHDALSVTVRA